MRALIPILILLFTVSSSAQFLGIGKKKREREAEETRVAQEKSKEDARQLAQEQERLRLEKVENEYLKTNSKCKVLFSGQYQEGEKPFYTTLDCNGIKAQLKTKKRFVPEYIEKDGKRVKNLEKIDVREFYKNGVYLPNTTVLYDDKKGEFPSITPDGKGSSERKCHWVKREVITMTGNFEPDIMDSAENVCGEVGVSLKCHMREFKYCTGEMVCKKGVDLSFYYKKGNGIRAEVNTTDTDNLSINVMCMTEGYGSDSKSMCPANPITCAQDKAIATHEGTIERINARIQQGVGDLESSRVKEK